MKRLVAPAIVAGAVLAITAAMTGIALADTGQVALMPVSAADLGPNVTVFDPSMPISQIQATLDATVAAQVDNEMGTARYAFLFKPGTYGTDTQPLQIRMGYYEEIAGLGASPNDVVINGKVDVYNRCLANNGTANCIALVNFWRSLSNLTLNINTAGEGGCRASANFWAVSQGDSLRRMNISGKNLSLMDYCTAGPQWASGGFIADSKLPFTINGSQQQWLLRNSVVAGWSNAVWNQVFAGVTGAPSESAFPNPPYTTLATTPVSREKPYLFIDTDGSYAVRVPSVATNSSGISWGNGMTAGRTVPLSSFFIANPSSSVSDINNALSQGQNLLFTPGVYSISHTIVVKRADTVVLGLGYPTLTSDEGATPLKVDDVAGVMVAGLTFDAGPQISDTLLQIGKAEGNNHNSDPADPTTLSDIYFRVGGPHIGSTNIAMRISSDDVLVDNTWVWRADHGVEGLTNTQRWTTNIGNYGVVVDGNNVTALGLAVEHFRQFNTLWNGNGGTTIFYQNELPYDPPTQADWMNGSELGYPGYKVADSVTTHNLYGGGVYVFNQNNPSIHTANGFEAPDIAGVQLHHIMTVNLSAGTIDHVINGLGGPADTTRIGQPVDIVDYP
jgi:hypothetical protein